MTSIKSKLKIGFYKIKLKYKQQFSKIKGKKYIDSLENKDNIKDV